MLPCHVFGRQRVCAVATSVCILKRWRFSYFFHLCALQYCDATCVMGYCCDRVCPNAAHMWALGWADPASGPSAADAQGQGGDLGVTDGGAAAAAAMGGSLVLEGLTEGLTLPYRLPAQHSSDASFVMIDAAAATGGIRYFLSYRDGTTSGVYDSTVGSSLHVHGHLTGTARRRYTDTGAWMDSVHVAALAAGDVWRDEQTREWRRRTWRGALRARVGMGGVGNGLCITARVGADRD